MIGRGDGLPKPAVLCCGAAAGAGLMALLSSPPVGATTKTFQRSARFRTLSSGTLPPSETSRMVTSSFRSPSSSRR